MSRFPTSAIEASVSKPTLDHVSPLSIQNLELTVQLAAINQQLLVNKARLDSRLHMEGCRELGSWKISFSRFSGKQFSVAEHCLNDFKRRFALIESVENFALQRCKELQNLVDEVCSI